MEGANEAEVVARVILDGTAYLVSVAGKGALSMLGFLATAAGHGIVKGIDKAVHAEKTAGQARLATLLKSGKELKLFTFEEHNIEEFKDEAKRYGIVYSMVKRSDKDKENGVYDVLCKAEDASRLQRILERMGVAEVSVSATGKEADSSEAASDKISDVRELLSQMLQPDERTQNPEQAADANAGQSAAISSFMEADSALETRQSVSDSISDIKKHISEYQPEKENPQSRVASMLAGMLMPSGQQERKDSARPEPGKNENIPGQNQGGSVPGITEEITKEIAKEYESLINSLNKSRPERGKE